MGKHFGDGCTTLALIQSMGTSVCCILCAEEEGEGAMAAQTAGTTDSASASFHVLRNMARGGLYCNITMMITTQHEREQASIVLLLFYCLFFWYAIFIIGFFFFRHTV